MDPSNIGQPSTSFLYIQTGTSFTFNAFTNPDATCIMTYYASTSSTSYSAQSLLTNPAGAGNVF
jgi:hypothetical protein